MLFRTHLPIAFALWMAHAAYSQDVRASITGVVSDPSGSPITGARVTATEPASGRSVSTQTNETGSYLTPFLAPGRWELSVEATGFQKYLRKDIVLQALDRARVDVKLDIGEVTSSVTVNGAVSQLETETSSRSQVLANEVLANIPTQGRNPVSNGLAGSGVSEGTAWR